jgi:hypothetical protein
MNVPYEAAPTMMRRESSILFLQFILIHKYLNISRQAEIKGRQVWRTGCGITLNSPTNSMRSVAPVQVL